MIADVDTMAPRRIHALPVGHRWDRVPGVTLLGDAAHLMSPFAGEGANLAMLDGAELASAIAAYPGDTEAALTAYEEALVPRSEASANDSAQSLDTMFGPQGLERMTAFFTTGPAAPQTSYAHCCAPAAPERTSHNGSFNRPGFSVLLRLRGRGARRASRPRRCTERSSSTRCAGRRVRWS